MKWEGIDASGRATLQDGWYYWPGSDTFQWVEGGVTWDEARRAVDASSQITPAHQSEWGIIMAIKFLKQGGNDDFIEVSFGTVERHKLGWLVKMRDETQ